MLCPPPCSAVAYLMCSEHRPLACCVVLCCTVRASWWLSLVVPVWGDEEKVGAGEQQCSAGEHHCD